MADVLVAGRRAAPPARGRLSAGLIGPAFVVGVAYVDPGNVATNTAAGSAHGLVLLWVVVLAMLMAGPVQYASAKLGLVTGASLPSVVAGRCTRRARLAYWVQAELVAVATDVAEVVGAAVGLNLLFGLPLLAGGLVAGLVSLAVLVLRDRHGARVLEWFCLGSLGLVGAGFAVGLVLAPPAPSAIVSGLVPRLGDSDLVLLAAGIVGATIMPHAVYLHSALTARPEVPAGLVDASALRSRLRLIRVDITLAMLVAGGINVSMMVLGSSLHGSDDTLAGAAAALADRAGSAAGVAFAVALTVSGLASSAVGTQGGSVIMAGLLRRRVPDGVRRLGALLPALLLLSWGSDPLRILVLSQVCLALGLPFALIPLLRATGDRRVMGRQANGPALRVAVTSIAGVVILLDLTLVVLTVARSS